MVAEVLEQFKNDQHGWDYRALGIVDVFDFMRVDKVTKISTGEMVNITAVAELAEPLKAAYLRINGTTYRVVSHGPNDGLGITALNLLEVQGNN